jgi:hypothetical protein
MRSKNIFGAAIAMFIVGAATAPSATAAPPDDACSLLTQAQVSAALGVSLGAGSHVTPTYLKTCTWAPSGGATTDVKYLTLSLWPADSYEAGKKLMEQAKTKMAATGEDASQFANTSVSGVGDDAYYTTIGGNSTSLMVKKGNVAFKVAIYGGLPIEKKETVEKTLALQVISKL